MQESLYTALASTFSGRLYPLQAPLPQTIPYAVYQVISQVPSNVLTGAPGLFNSRVQIDVFTLSYAEGQQLKDATRAAMQTGLGDAAKEISTTDLWEDEVKLYRVMMDWSVWHS